MIAAIASHDEPEGFIDVSEAAYYERIARQHFQGEGCIVDAGCFIGSSTRALLRGLDRFESEPRRPCPVIAIDRFTVSDHYIAGFFLERGIDIRFGESFLPVFLQYIGADIALVEARAGDLTQVGRIDRMIEIAVIDLAKTPMLNAYALQHWIPRMFPGHGLIVQQDFYSPTQPWIAHSMASLLDYVSLELDKVGESAVFRLERPIPPNVLADATRGWDRREGLRRLDRMIELLGPRASAPLRLMQALALNSLGETYQARCILENELSAAMPPADQKWEKWLSAAIIAVMPEAFGSKSMLGRLYWHHGAQRLGHA